MKTTLSILPQSRQQLVVFIFRPHRYAKTVVAQSNTAAIADSDSTPDKIFIDQFCIRHSGKKEIGITCKHLITKRQHSHRIHQTLPFKTHKRCTFDDFKRVARQFYSIILRNGTYIMP